MVIAFLAIIVLGAIFGPAIQLPGTSSTPTAPGVATSEPNDWKYFIEYFYKNETRPDEDHEREKTAHYDGGSYETKEYKVYEIEKEDDDGDTYTERMVGYRLNLDVFDYIDDAIQDMEDEDGDYITTDAGDWIDADIVDSHTELALGDMVDLLENIAVSRGITYTTYQLFAIADYYYDNGGLKKIEYENTNNTGLIKTWEQIYGAMTEEENLQSYRASTYTGNAMSNQLGANTARKKLFFTGSFGDFIVLILDPENNVVGFENKEFFCNP